MNSLRAELIEAQKARNDFMKWKLLIVAGVGGAGLGFSDNGPTTAHFALAVLPFACAYVDLLCRNLSLRIKAIGLFIQHGPHDAYSLRQYENFYQSFHDTVWEKKSLESWALLWSTIVTSLAVLPLGILSDGSSWHPIAWPSGLFYASSLSGLVLAIWIEVNFRRKMRDAIELAPNVRRMQLSGSTTVSRPSGDPAPEKAHRD